MMNLKDQMILEDYEAELIDFRQIKEIVDSTLKNIAKEEDILPMGLESRIKNKESLEGKLMLKGEKYKSLDDITDIFGARFICFFKDEVYKVAKRIEDIFIVDWDNSVDKSTILNDESFGYLSLHYVCSLPADRYPKNLCGKRFEIQLRSGLQHIWAAISHDTTYKSEFDVPHEIRRSLSRLAGLLELADDEFIRVRDEMSSYTKDIQDKITSNHADDIPINVVSLKEYMLKNKEMRRFLSSLASIENSEITNVSPDAYFDQFRWLGMKKLGDIQEMLKNNEQLALQLANKALKGSKLDILASTVALHFLCQAELLKRGYSQEKIAEFMTISNNDQERSKRQAKRLLDNYDKYINIKR